MSAPTLPEIGSQELRPNESHLFPRCPAIKTPSWLCWMYYSADVAKQMTQMSIAYSTDPVPLDGCARPSDPRQPTENVRFTGRRTWSTPLVNDGGILLIYDGGDDNNVYRTGWVRFDKSDPTKVLGLAQEPIFEPMYDWERKGQVPDAVFVEGLAGDGERSFSIIAVGTSTWV
jgi:predicted GH43/DUF377 family glycosyl hydrolase